MDLNTYIADVASSKSAPGGGSVIPLTGALGTALGCMVLEITKEKVKDADLDRIDHILSQGHAYIDQLKDLSQKDAEVSGKMFAQYALPRETEEEKARRTAAIQEALLGATEVPLQVMETSLKAMRLLEEIAEIGRKSVLADVEVGVQHLYTALQCAKYNVLENVNLIKDEEKAQAYQDRADQALQGSEEVKAAVLAAVDDRRK
ncbi:cyclodeaminase/cyclohydrolase family protein [Aerococcus sanguinicola]|uniref:cyclodeaminase/cyclohydrolase family protein n=1 Tax=unclassified Aerococcus TaxID=2618060 RepID=UPI0008A5F1E8|nr:MULTISPECIES: cyclodeaminase/cyclohydrolase family protein [unclassified Aerococcus]MDK6234031.1 cyclodeaminase/cyclohydrolase family protein [Aerococcus sp. UMB10185]MDK6856564.1 cyclodeaminase/cyclohydrolase family protein [Aerococcus sp. UMB7533]MDK8502012.1 cyclodeaminase/cyclohydrolase family protein [Aerococcus sp. UMB1112A]OFN03565.1 hypothetical protein HMPREF2626_05830 [Aerococcus sp. HMSC062A02]OHO45780.1 hypothetical protein HMPREF2705_03935 [Aerococcus sp. HMSC035B07]